jgi:hypothetical protein
MMCSRSLVGILLLGLTMASAKAFQETAPASEPAGPAAVTEQPQSDESPLGLAGDEQQSETPGSDSVGIGGLPSLNFGLELLYGGKAQPQGGPAADATDDVGVTGRFKHTF